jgi:hypothetical protein
MQRREEGVGDEPRRSSTTAPARASVEHAAHRRRHADRSSASEGAYAFAHGFLAGGAFYVARPARRDLQFLC